MTIQDAGESYVVFGKADSASVDLGALGSGGFRIDGINKEDYSGFSVSGAGDLNGDGFDDVIIGAWRADPDGTGRAGESYVVFGKADSASIELGALGTGGFRIDGINFYDSSGNQRLRRRRRQRRRLRRCDRWCQSAPVPMAIHLPAKATWSLAVTDSNGPHFVYRPRVRFLSATGASGQGTIQRVKQPGAEPFLTATNSTFDALPRRA